MPYRDGHRSGFSGRVLKLAIGHPQRWPIRFAELSLDGGEFQFVCRLRQCHERAKCTRSPRKPIMSEWPPSRAPLSEPRSSPYPGGLSDQLAASSLLAPRKPGLFDRVKQALDDNRGLLDR